MRQHINTSRGLFPHKRITRKSEMTTRGLVVIEQEEDIIASVSSGHGSSAASSSAHAHGHGHGHGRHGHTPSSGAASSNVKGEEAGTPRKSPIAELLYLRWIEGLKLKWPNFS